MEELQEHAPLRRVDENKQLEKFCEQLIHVGFTCYKHQKQPFGDAKVTSHKHRYCRLGMVFGWHCCEKLHPFCRIALANPLIL